MSALTTRQRNQRRLKRAKEATERLERVKDELSALHHEAIGVGDDFAAGALTAAKAAVYAIDEIKP